tara:strand:+ start:73 stop:180 length:108 start_codon:yes stop_codon:yes gene_type:complete
MSPPNEESAKIGKKLWKTNDTNAMFVVALAGLTSG